MTELILNNLYLIVLLPLWIFLVIIGGRFFSVYVSKNVIYTLTTISSLLGAIFCSIGLIKFSVPVEQSFAFIKINDFIINIGIHIDKLSLIIALVLFLVSFFVQIFSISYMKNEPKNYRFFALLNLFNFSMAGLLFSPNLFQMYCFWELVGVASYLLIGFDYKNIKNSIASKRVFIINRVGDTALIGAIIMSSYFMYNYASNYTFTTLSFEDMNAISTLLYAYTSTPHFYIIASLFIIGAIVKSAQFPFYVWLQDAMEAKLPVSALLHSATMVVAGIYLVIRLLPILSLEQGILNIICWVGIFTALICSVIASIETHPKKVLAYSTSANLGLMFLAIGVLNIKATIIFLIAHAFIKSMLFLALPQKRDEISFANFILFALGALSLSGIAFSGLVAKEFLFLNIENQIIFAILYCIISFFTAFYIIRLSLLVAENKKLVKKCEILQIVPIVGLFVFNFAFYIFIRKTIMYSVAEPFWAAIIAWVLVYFLYMKNLLKKFSTTYSPVQNVMYKKIPTFYEKVANVTNRLDLNVFANYKLITNFSRYSVKIVGWIEKNIMEESVHVVSNFCKNIAQIDFKLQKRNIQIYNAYAFIILTAVISFIIIIYTFMLNQLN